MMNKGKVIIISVGVFLILLIIVIFSFMNSGESKDEKNSLPPLLNTKDSLSYKDMIDLNQNNTYGQEEKTPVNNAKEVEETLNNIYSSQPSNNYSQPSNNYSEPSNNYTQPTTSYNPYGNRDMYSIPDKKQKKEVISKNIDEIKEQNNEDYSYNPVPVPVTSSSNKYNDLQSRKAKFESNNSKSELKGINKKEIKAVIRGEQKINNGHNLRIALSENTIIGGVNVPKGTIIYANARFNDDRVDLAINTFKVGSKIVNGSNLKVYSNDGLEGIPINTSQLMVNGKSIATNEAKREMSSYGGRVGGLISQLISSKQDLSITFLDNQILYLK